MKLTVFISIIIGLFLSEGLLQFFNKNDAKQKYLSFTFGKDISRASTPLKIGFDQRSKFEVYCDLKNRGAKSIPNIHPRDLRGTGTHLKINGNKVFQI